ncbi:MAG: PilZ domain-containing protein [Acidobacteriia bacterium]|nr:PilZ domain-containing protein [Terriglobia bacterium]
MRRGDAGQVEKEQRRELRARVAQRWRIRIPDTDYPPEICTTHNVSRCGLYFLTSSTHYLPGMTVCVIRNFDPDDQLIVEEVGTIVRVDSYNKDQKGVAIQVLTKR